jgi:colanic acid biosynthesis glycosyl transferase WcaI
MGAPSARVHELSREWVREGHEVTVLTGFPHHPTGIVPPEYRGQWLRREWVDGIRVVRVPIHVAPNRAVARRALSYLSYGLSASLLGPFLTGRPDVVVATSPQFLTAVAGWWLSLVLWRPFVFEVRDIWPRSIVEVGAMKADSLVVRILEKVERFLYRRADRIVAVTHSFVDELAGKGVPRTKMSVVTNGVDLDLFRPGDKGAARRALGLPDGFLATYVGTHGMAHGLDMVLDAAKRVQGTGIRVLLVGEGAEKSVLQDRARSEGIANVTFWDQQTREKVSEVIAATDVCLVVLRDKPLFRTVIPSKIFEFMGAARPMLTTVDGESRRIIEDAGAGVFSPPERAEDLARALLDLSASPEKLEDMGRSGREHVERYYSRPALARSYLEILEATCDKGRA